MILTFIIKNLAYTILIFVLGIILFTKSLNSGNKYLTNNFRITHKIILAFTIFVFGLLVLKQAGYQILNNKNIFELKKIYDKRSWIIEKNTKKGTIYDRTGKIENVFAISTKVGLNLYARIYPFDSSAAHIIGYVDRKKGRAGMEKVFKDMLMGNSGGGIKNISQKISNGYRISGRRGFDVYLSIDAQLQKEGFTALNGRRGAVVVMDPNSGEVLALVSSPAYSPKDIINDVTWDSLVSDRANAPLFNRAVSGLYPPGSVLKPLIAALAVEKNIDPLFYAGPEGFLPKYAVNPVRDDEYFTYKNSGRIWKGHGKIKLANALKKSSNVYFGLLGLRLGEKNVTRLMKEFYFDKQLNWNTANKALSEYFKISPSKFSKGKRFTPEELAWSSLGQYKVLITPLQAAVYTSAIANGGKVFLPSLEKNRFPKIVSNPISRSTSKKIRELMREVVKSGTGWRVNMPGFKIAGKTGTAQVGGKKPHSWFISFAPYDNPEIVIIALIENGGYGSVEAAKVVKKMYLKAVKLGYLKSGLNLNE